MTKHARQLIHDELIALNQFANGDDAFARNRASIILLSATGKSTSEIADAIDVSHRCVRHVIHSFNKHGMQVMRKGKRSGRPCSLTDLQREALVELLKKQPRDFGIDRGSWTLQSLAVVLLSEGVCENVSTYTLQREMKRLGVSWRELKIRGIAKIAGDINSANRESSFRRGTYADRMLRLGERELYDEVIANLQKDYATPNGTPSLHMELTAIYSVKLIGAQASGNWELAELFDRMMHNHLRELKAAAT